jgi:PAS domain S-box-containing protein
MNGQYTFTSEVWPSILAVLMFLALAFYSWRRRNVPGAWVFAISCLFAAAWTAGWVMQTAAVGLTTKIFWLKFQAIWQTPLITLITCFCLEYAWPGRWLTRRNLILFFIPCLLSTILILTDHYHHLIWNSLVLNQYAQPELAPGSFLLVVYFLVVLEVLNLIILGWLFYQSPQHRWPVVIMMFGQIIGRTLYLLDETRIFPYSPSLIVPPVVFEYLMYAIALFGFRIFDPMPLARRAAVDQAHAGMLVLDHEGNVASINPAAERILGVHARQVKGKPAWELLPDHSMKALLGHGAAETELSFEETEARRYYGMTVSMLRDFRGLEVGRLVMMYDVTGQKRAQEQILEQQRALAVLNEREQIARELHDNLGQVFAFVNMQAQAVRRLLDKGDILSADEHLHRMIEVAREADTDIRESILGLRTTLTEHRLFRVLTQYLSKYEKNYGIHAQLEGWDAFSDEMFEPSVEVQLLRILQEALTNIRKHADANYVEIKFASENHGAYVTIRDDGQGFDIAKRENALDEHVGLRVMRERAEQVGGSLSLHSQPGFGTQLTVYLPVRRTVHV